MTCPRRCKVTLVAFVWLFSTVLFQMLPQINCLKGCIITLVEFIRFFPPCVFKWVLRWPAWEDEKSNIQMFPRVACLKRCIITLVAIVKKFVPNTNNIPWNIFTFLHFYIFTFLHFYIYSSQDALKIIITIWLSPLSQSNTAGYWPNRRRLQFDQKPQSNFNCVQ